MGLGGDGPKTIAVTWSLSAVTFVWVCLRFYTRRIVIRSYGLDDHVYMLAFVFQLVSSCLVHTSAHYGLGRKMVDIEHVDNITKAAFYGILSQVFAAASVAVAKWSLGLFLLRIVEQKTYKLSIWLVLGFLTGSSFAWILIFWLQCTPYAYLYDRTIPGGKCDVPFLGVSILHASSCVLTDIAFAVLPWIFLGKLQMHRREKLITLGSLSLGFIAGIFGIIRATKLPALWSDNYLREGVGIITWTAAEMTVTMVCIGIPVCRPLYKRWVDRWLLNSIHSRPGNNDQFRKHESYMATTETSSHFGVAAGGPKGLVPLRTIGVSSPTPDMGGMPLAKCSASKGSMSSDDMETRKHGPLSRAYLATAGRVMSRNDRANASDEETLAGDYQEQEMDRPNRRHHSRRHRERRKPSNRENQISPDLGLLMGITVTEEFQVTSNKDDV